MQNFLKLVVNAISIKPTLFFWFSACNTSGMDIIRESQKGGGLGLESPLSILNGNLERTVSPAKRPAGGGSDEGSQRRKRYVIFEAWLPVSVGGGGLATLLIHGLIVYELYCTPLSRYMLLPSSLCWFKSWNIRGWMDCGWFHAASITLLLHWWKV